jgi:hypothetical protein
MSDNAPRDAAGRRLTPQQTPEFHKGRPPKNKGPLRSRHRSSSSPWHHALARALLELRPRPAHRPGVLGVDRQDRPWRLRAAPAHQDALPRDPRPPRVVDDPSRHRPWRAQGLPPLRQPEVRQPAAPLPRHPGRQRRGHEPQGPPRLVRRHPQRPAQVLRGDDRRGQAAPRRGHDADADQPRDGRQRLPDQAHPRRASEEERVTSRGAHTLGRGRVERPRPDVGTSRPRPEQTTAFAANGSSMRDRKGAPSAAASTTEERS